MKHNIYLLALIVFVLSACKRNNNDESLPVSVTSFWPNSGNSGTIVTVKGHGFRKNTAILFNGTEAKVMDTRDTVLIALAPENGTTGMLTVKDGERKIEVGNYTYQALSIQRVTPLNGPAGTNISVYGAGFTSLKSPAKVKVNGKDAFVTGVSDTLLIATVPESAGTGKIVVEADGKTVEGPEFLFQQINTMKPLTGGTGTSVVLEGTGFDANIAANTVTFNGKAAIVTEATATKLVVKAPDGVTTGPVAITINGQKTVGQVFTVVPKPQIKTVAPLSAPANTNITVTGDNFSAFTDEVNVTINGKVATVVTTADKQLIVKVPVGAGAGKMVITVNGQVTEGPEFKEQALGISRLVPDNGLAGSTVVIKGIGFDVNANANRVTFNGVSVAVNEATDTTLKVVLPAGISTGLVKVATGSLDATGPEFKRAGVMTIAGGPDLNTFNDPKAAAADSKGNIFVADINVIKKVTPDGTVTIFAGRSDNSAGNIDGNGSNAAFSYITNIVIDKQDNIYVTDNVNRAVRKITPNADVSTFSKININLSGMGIDKNDKLYVGGQYDGVYKIDAFGNASRWGRIFNTVPGNLGLDNNGALYFTGDLETPVVYKMTDDGLTTFAGSQYGSNDGTYATAMFGSMNAVAYNRNTDELYVSDNNAIRYLYNGMVTRVAGWRLGTSVVMGYKDGTLAECLFSGINNISLDREGNLIVVERNNKSLRKIFFK